MFVFYTHIHNRYFGKITAIDLPFADIFTIITIHTWLFWLFILVIMIEYSPAIILWLVGLVFWVVMEFYFNKVCTSCIALMVSFFLNSSSEVILLGTVIKTSVSKIGATFNGTTVWELFAWKKLILSAFLLLRQLMTLPAFSFSRSMTYVWAGKVLGIFLHYIKILDL